MTAITPERLLAPCLITSPEAGRIIGLLFTLIVLLFLVGLFELAL